MFDKEPVLIGTPTTKDLGWRRASWSAGRALFQRQSVLVGVLAVLASFGARTAPAEALRPPPVAAAIRIDSVFGPLLQEGAPIEDRIRLVMRDLLRELRRAFKLSKYLVTSSPAWWWQRAKRAVWPLIFALTALFCDAALLAEWKNDGLRVLINYVPMMLYVYGRLFVSAGTSIIVRFGVVLSLAYGIWIDDFIRDGSWYSLGKGRVDDFVLIFGAVRAFVASCPEHLVEMYAERAIAIRGRLVRSLRRTG